MARRLASRYGNEYRVSAARASMVQVGPRCSTKVQPVLYTFWGGSVNLLLPQLRARSSAWKAVSLSIQNSSRTIPNANSAYQNLLVKDPALRRTRRRSGENYRGIQS